MLRGASPILGFTRSPGVNGGVEGTSTHSRDKISPFALTGGLERGFAGPYNLLNKFAFYMISGKQCRNDCGFSGIDKNSCTIDQGCCWDSGTPGIPWYAFIHSY